MAHTVTYGGVKIFVSAAAYAAHWNFPKSNNRSKRVHKKLMKRFGRQVENRPMCYEIEGKLIMHPILYRELLARLAEQQQRVDAALTTIGAKITSEMDDRLLRVAIGSKLDARAFAPATLVTNPLAALGLDFGRS